MRQPFPPDALMPATPNHSMLSSVRVRARFGSYGVDVLEGDERNRRSSLYSSRILHGTIGTLPNSELLDRRDLSRLQRAGDLEFELLVRGIGRIRDDEQAIHETWHRRVPRSEWLERLRATGARNVLLLEVPLPVRKTSGPWARIARDLQHAEEYLRNGDYHGCVSTCRLVVQSLGQHKFKRSEWAGSLLKRLSDNGSNMSKHERESALWACLRHYTHQAHHTEDEGGEAGYSRADAMLILTLTASFVAHAQSG